MMAAEHPGRSALSDAAGCVHSPFLGSARIVSLVPSLTETVVDMGLGASLVGRTGFCVHPREALRAIPKLGGTKDVHIDRLCALEPTHVLVNIDENRRECVEEIARRVPHVVVTHPCAPEDNAALYRLLGGIFGRPEQARRLCKELDAALAAAQSVSESLPPESVLYLIWREPWMGVAPGTYISATLARVGWISWPPEPAPRYPEVSLKRAIEAGVQRLLLSTEPYRFRSMHADELSEKHAVAANLIDGTLASWYGSRAPRALHALAALRRALPDASAGGHSPAAH